MRTAMLPRAALTPMREYSSHACISCTYPCHTLHAVRHTPQVRHVPELHELMTRQRRTQAAMLLTVDPVHIVAGASLRRTYVEAQLAALQPPKLAVADGPAAGGADVACAHCKFWPSRPLFNGFSDTVPGLIRTDLDAPR